METLNCIESNPVAMFFVGIVGLALIAIVAATLARFIVWLWDLIPYKVGRATCKLCEWVGWAITWIALTALALTFLWGAWETLLCVIN